MGPRFRRLCVLGCAAAIAACVPLPPRAASIPDRPALVRQLCEKAPGLRPEVLERALEAYACASRQRQVGGSVMAVVDYELPSTERRFWLVDLSRGDILRAELVAHGKNSGDNVATRFSNQVDSLQSSLGLYRVLDTYQGSHGYSLRLRGLEPGFNDNAERRGIVIHGADYVADEVAREQGRLGRSWGCPALDARISRQVIGALENGAAVFVYYPDPGWLEKSPLLHCQN